MAQINVDNFGVGLHVFHGAFCQNFSLMHDRDFLRDPLHKFHVVLDHNHRAVITDAL